MTVIAMVGSSRTQDYTAVLDVTGTVSSCAYAAPCTPDSDTPDQPLEEDTGIGQAPRGAEPLTERQRFPGFFCADRVDTC